MVGSQTVIRDDPSLTIRKVDSDGSSNQQNHSQYRGEITKMQVSGKSVLQLLAGRRTSVVIKGIESISMPTVTESKKPDDLLDLLGDRGIQELLIEGGPSVWTSFLKME